MRRFLVGSVALIVYIALLLGMSVAAYGQQPKYVFYFIGDGMGVNQVTATQLYKASLRGVIGADSLSFTNFPVRSFVTTYSASSQVTCSSAAGTAMACGVKTRNKSVGVDALGRPVESIAERAKRAGNSVAIVTTVSVNHATPAAFYAHQGSRGNDYGIVKDALRAGFDIYAGAGVRHRNAAKSPNLRDVFDLFADSSYVIACGKAQFDAKSATADRMLYVGNKSDESGICLVPVIDRRGGELTLPELTQGAMDFLIGKDKGFFMMVEGGTIDWVQHSNDAAASFAEIGEFSDAVKVAYDFYLQHPTQTLILVTADHETGGITVGKQEGSFNIALLENQKSSQLRLSGLFDQLRKQQKVVSWQSVRRVLERELGFWGNVEISAEDEALLRECYRKNFTLGKVESVESLYMDVDPMAAYAVSVLMRLAEVGWATGGHTAGVVPVYAIGVGAEKFGMARDNTDLPKIISQITGY